MRVDSIPSHPSVVRIYYKNNSIASYISTMLFLRFYEQQNVFNTKCYLNKVNGTTLSEEQLARLNTSITRNDLNVFIDVLMSNDIQNKKINYLLVNTFNKEDTNNEYKVDTELLKSLNINTTSVNDVYSVVIAYKLLRYLHTRIYDSDITPALLYKEMDSNDACWPKLIQLYKDASIREIKAFENITIKPILEIVPSHLSINFTKNSVFNLLFNQILFSKEYSDNGYETVTKLSVYFKQRDYIRDKILAHKTVRVFDNFLGIENMTALVANVPEVSNTFFNQYISEDTSYDIGVSYYKTTTNWKVTLYALNKNVDILKIANMYKFNSGNKYVCSFFINDIIKLLPNDYESIE